MNLQVFADPAGAGGSAEPQAQTQTPPAAQSTSPTTEIDYGKIQQMLDGTLAAKEDTALKAYFKQQGLSQEEMNQAIVTFKEQKAAQQPDVNAIQQQLTQAQQAAQTAEIEKQATIEALGLGIDVKTVPYVLKMADLTNVMDADGKMSTETLKAALNKVLDDIPALKPEKQENKGFQQIGAASGQQPSGDDDALASIFGNKKG